MRESLNLSNGKNYSLRQSISGDKMINKKTLLSSGFMFGFLFMLSFLFSSIYLSGLASANLVVDPAKLGILRLQLFPMSPAVAIREFRVGNTYDVPMYIELEPVGDMKDLITFSETNFTLQANQSKTIEYTVTIKESGYYDGGVLIKANIENKGFVGYRADLAVFVYKSNLQPYFYVAIAAVAIAVASVFILFFRKTSRRASQTTHKLKRKSEEK